MLRNGLRHEFVEGADREAEAERTAGEARVREVVAVVDAGVVELARVAETADGAHEIEVGVEEIGVDTRDEWIKETCRQIERTDEHGAVKLRGGHAVSGAVVIRECGHRSERRRCGRPGRGWVDERRGWVDERWR